jgi:hypothetical protein
MTKNNNKNIIIKAAIMWPKTTIMKGSNLYKAIYYWPTAKGQNWNLSVRKVIMWIDCTIIIK